MAEMAGGDDDDDDDDVDLFFLKDDCFSFCLSHLYGSCSTVILHTRWRSDSATTANLTKKRHVVLRAFHMSLTKH